ncbi:MAG: CxxC-x17-CxxC domain protein [Firmicutes bacterium]|nr:CxxC-x17-CxxC domain protein [Bacillota bacterium]
MAEDKKLTCKECNTPFVFSASEQDFYAEKGFTNEPGRCPECRSARKQQGGGFNRRDNNNRPPREMHAVTCSECGKETEVPFRPSGDRPVYCRDCFSQNNSRY